MSHHQDLNLAVTCVFASVLPIDLRLSHGLFICLENPTQALILYRVMKDWSMKLTKVFGSFMASASPLFHPETWQKYLARHIDLLHSSQSLSCVTASVPCCRVQLSNLFNLVLLRKLGSPPSPCSDVAEIRPFLITRKSMGHPTSEDQGSDPAIKGLPKKSSPVVPASFESQVEVSFSQ